MLIYTLSLYMMIYCKSRKVCTVVVLIIWLNLIALIKAQDNPYSCSSNGNYTTKSTYGANLGTLLASLSSNITDNGYYTSSVGLNQDRANALALCRADRTLDQCRSCVQSAVREVLQRCPKQRQAVIWFEYCTLRYSNDPIHNTQTSDPGSILRNSLNVSNAVQFGEDRSRLLEDLRARAANGSSELKVGAGSRNTSDSVSQMINGLVQCTPDLSSEECGGCLMEAAQYMTNCCNISRGVRMLMPNCSIRYELYGFYNETRLRELLVLPPPGRNDNNTREISGKKHNNDNKTTIIVVVSIAVCIVLAVCGVMFLRRRKIKQGISKTTDQISTVKSLQYDKLPSFIIATDQISTVESLQYDFGTIRAATNDFDDANKLGQGGFGAVYKGKLQNGEQVAVKRLSKDSGQGNVEFKNEVLLVAKLQHRNLVRLLGFSQEGAERLLVYEFVQNASLDKFIFDPIKRSLLDWDKRSKIIRGVARGLVYLHEDSRLKIVHRDLKASNVLLDGDMNPKIADFGMARLFGQDETQANIHRIVGTYGYMSPEYAMHGQFSIKSDVFSFGVLILEILSGQRNSGIKNRENAEDLLTLTWKKWQEGTAANLIDPTLLGNGTGALREMLRCIHMGLLCVQENDANRPTMSSIVLMLSSSTVTLPVPSEPAFYMASRYGPEFSKGSSQNEMSATELYPR